MAEPLHLFEKSTKDPESPPLSGIHSRLGMRASGESVLEPTFTLLIDPTGHDRMGIGKSFGDPNQIPLFKHSRDF
jgi:hypothetical protein